MYYLLSITECRRRWIDKIHRVKGARWWRGAVVSVDIPDPLEYTFETFLVLEAHVFPVAWIEKIQGLKQYMRMQIQNLHSQIII